MLTEEDKYQNPEDRPDAFNGTGQESVSAEPVTPSSSRADEIIRQLHTSYSPRPKVDQDKLDRLQRIGRLNQFGQTANVLGDMFALAKGANVRQRRPDTTSPAIYEAYQRALDRNKEQGDQADLRDWQLNRENLKMDLDLENRREANRLRKAIADANNEVAREKARYDYEKYIANLQFKRQEGDKNRKNRIQAAGIRASNSKEEKSIKVQTRSGNVYTLQPHEFNSFRNQVYNNPENYPSLFDREEIVREQKNNLGRMEKVPTGEYKYKLKSGADDNAMAQAYFEREEDAPVRYRDQAARDNTQREMESYINDSTRPNQTAQKKIDYSKLNF